MRQGTKPPLPPDSIENIVKQATSSKTERESFKRANRMNPDALALIGEPPYDVTNAKQHKSASVEIMNTAPKSEVTKMLDNILFWYKETPVKSPEECAERLNKFFNRVRETGEIPTVEKLALSLGLTVQALSNWENAKDLEIRACLAMAKKAKSIIAAMDAELAANGAIDKVVYIFRSKNYYGMSDETKIEISAKTNVENIDEKELAQRILEDKESYKK